VGFPNKGDVTFASRPDLTARESASALPFKNVNLPQPIRGDEGAPFIGPSNPRGKPKAWTGSRRPARFA
jgi:hypothetical protein